MAYADSSNSKCRAEWRRGESNPSATSENANKTDEFQQQATQNPTQPALVVPNELFALIDSWPKLPESVKAVILELVKQAAPK